MNIISKVYDSYQKNKTLSVFLDLELVKKIIIDKLILK